MFRIQKAIKINVYMLGQFTQNEVIGFICMLGVPEFVKDYVHGSLKILFSLFIVMIYIFMCLPVRAKDKKRYHVYLSFFNKKGADIIGYVEDKKYYQKEKR